MADHRDAADPLADVRTRFMLPSDVIYLDGNSLGPPARSVVERLHHVVAEQWGDGLIRSWNDADWVGLPARCAQLLAPWLGARDARSVTVTDSITVNLGKLVGAALTLRPDRRTILTVSNGFPTDAYVIGSITRFANAFVGAGPPIEVVAVPAHQIAARLGEDVAVLSLPHVDYRTGARFDVASITEAAHAVGALTIWDTAHSAGALALALDDWGVDFAVGCSYKFLNAGPGGPAWIYVGPHLHDSAQNPLAGWFGHAAPFDFSPGWTPAPGAERFRSGTPAVLSFVGFEESLLAIEGVDPALVEAKAGALTEALLDHLTSAGAFDVGGLFEATGVELVTPLAAADRGAQVSLRMTHAWPVVRALAERGVIGDHRPPDLVRLGFAPLVTRFADASAGAQALLDILATESWRDARFRPRTVVP